MAKVTILQGTYLISDKERVGSLRKKSQLRIISTRCEDVNTDVRDAE